MKTLRIVLASVAMLLAIGGAFASHLLANNYYELKVVAGENTCIQHNVDFSCGASGQTICASISAPTVQLRDSSDPETSCGMPLWRAN